MLEEQFIFGLEYFDERILFPILKIFFWMLLIMMLYGAKKLMVHGIQFQWKNKELIVSIVKNYYHYFVDYIISVINFYTFFAINKLPK